MGNATDSDLARDTALAEVTAAAPSSFARAMAIIEAHALTGKEFSANDMRAEMDRAHVPTPVRGAAFGAAKKRGLIRVVDSVVSSDPGTHSKPVMRYIRAGVAQPGRESIVVSARRGPGGRFSADDVCTGQADLFSSLDVTS